MDTTRTCSGCKYYAACGDDDRIDPCDGREITKTVIVNEMEMPLLHDIRSIFDEELGRNFCHTGEYMVLMRDCKGNHYAMTKQDWYFAKRNGKTLGYGESAVFYGQKVRGMSESEEREWDESGYDGLHIVDLWGNMKEE